MRLAEGALVTTDELLGRLGVRGVGDRRVDVRDFPDATTLGVRRSSAGMGPPELERMLEVVPATATAHLHHVAGQFVVLTAELVEFLQGGHTPTVGRQAPSEDVGDVYQFTLLTDGARLLRGCSKVLGGTQ